MGSLHALPNTSIKQRLFFPFFLNTWNLLPLDLDATNDSNINEFADSHHVLFSERESIRILRLDGDYRPEDVLLAALTQTPVKWTQSPVIPMDQMGHGRTDLEDMDLSRTVGFLLSYRPLVLTIAPSHTLRSILPSTVDQIRRLPEGYTFDLLRCYTKDEVVKKSFKNLPRAEVLFNYTGHRRHSAFNESTTFKLCTDPHGPSQSPRVSRYYPLAINVGFKKNRLRFTIVYSRKLHKPNTIEDIAEWYRNTLLDIVEHR